MASGYTIPIAANTRAFQSEVKDAAKSLDDFKDTYDEINKGAKSGDQLSEDLKKVQPAAKEAGQSVETLEDKMKRLQGTTESSSSSSGTHISREFKKGAKEAGEGLSELKDSAKQNAIETSSSFDGSAQSIAAGFQAVASEALAGFGPLGLAAGLALGAGLGIVQGQLSNIGESAAAVQAAIKARTDDLISNKSLSASNEYLDDTIKTIVEDQGQLNDIKKMARQLGLSNEQAVRAEAGSNKDLSLALQRASDQLKKKQQAYKESNFAPQNEAEVKAAENLVSHYKDLVSQNKQAATAAKQYSSATSGLTAAQNAQAKATKAAQKAAGDAADSFAGAIQDDYSQAGSNISQFVKGAKFDLAGYTKSVEQQAKDAEAFQTNAATAVTLLAKGGHDKAISYLSKLGPDAAPLIAAFVKAPASQQASLEKVWDQLGGAASSSFGSTLKSDLKADQLTKSVKITADTSAYDAVVNSAAFRNGITIPVSLVPTKNSLGKSVP